VVFIGFLIDSHITLLRTEGGIKGGVGHKRRRVLVIKNNSFIHVIKDKVKLFFNLSQTNSSRSQPRFTVKGLGSGYRRESLLTVKQTAADESEQCSKKNDRSRGKES